MKLSFTKMQGAGNDFVMLDGVTQSIRPTSDMIRQLADRHFGVGADQVLLVEPATRPDADFRYRIFNADGSEVEHCGNGARCFVTFVHERGLSQANPLRAEIATGVIELAAGDDGEVTVLMGRTRFEPADLPFDAAGLVPLPEGRDQLWSLDLGLPGAEAVPVSLVAISNPHAVLRVADVNAAPVETWGPRIEGHARFPRRVNAGFMQVIDRQHIRLRVYERGAGETLACGTGACAAAVAGIRRGLLDSPVTVDTRGGRLSVTWDGESLWLKGPAVTVFHGTIELRDAE